MSFAKIQCSGCGAALKSTTPMPEGKRVKCPKCGVVFTISGKDLDPELAPPEAYIPELGRLPQKDAPSGTRARSEKSVTDVPDENEPQLANRLRKRRKKRRAEDENRAALKRRMLLVGLPLGLALILGIGLMAFVMLKITPGKKP